MLIKNIIDFYYERSSDRDTITLCVDHDCVREYPISYTIEECLEDYCNEQGWDFYHMQFGTYLDEGGGRGRFYYYHMFEGKRTKQIHFSWFTQHHERRIYLADDLSMYLREGDSVKDTLKEICKQRGWIFVSSDTHFPSYQYGDGRLRYRE